MKVSANRSQCRRPCHHRFYPLPHQTSPTGSPCTGALFTDPSACAGQKTEVRQGWQGWRRERQSARGIEAPSRSGPFLGRKCPDDRNYGACRHLRIETRLRSAPNHSYRMRVAAVGRLQHEMASKLQIFRGEGGSHRRHADDCGFAPAQPPRPPSPTARRASRRTPLLSKSWKQKGLSVVGGS